MYVLYSVYVCSTTSLSGELGCRRNEKMRSGSKSDIVGFFGANKNYWLKRSSIPSPPEAFTSLQMSPQQFLIRRLQPWFYKIWICAATYSISDLFVEVSDSALAGKLKASIKLRRRKILVVG